MNEFKREEILLRSWKNYRTHYKLLTIGGALVIGAYFFVFYGLMLHIQNMKSGLFIAVPFFVFGTLVQLGLIKIVLSISGNKSEGTRILFQQYRFILRYTVGIVLYCFVVCVGLLFFIIPGVVLAIRYSLWSLVLVNKDCDISTAYKESRRLTKGSNRTLFVLYFGFFGALSLSAIPFGIGLFFSYPFVMLSFGFVYRSLQLLRTTKVLHEKHIVKRKKETNPF
jgi:uncharacterized membrane protein